MYLYFKFMYLIYAFILFEMCLLFLNSCIYSIHVFIIIEFMYLLNSCISYFLIHVFIIFEYMYLLLLTIIYYYFKTCRLLYPFYDLMIFIYNPKEKLSSRKQYK